MKKIRTSQPQTKFTGSCKKKSVTWKITDQIKNYEKVPRTRRKLIRDYIRF